MQIGGFTEGFSEIRLLQKSIGVTNQKKNCISKIKFKETALFYYLSKLKVDF